MAHTYYRPPLAIRDVGRPLKATSFAALKDSLSDGEVLFELMEHANHEHYAVLMRGESTYDELKRLEKTHPYTHLGYYAVAWSDAEEGTDEAVENWER